MSDSTPDRASDTSGTDGLSIQAFLDAADLDELAQVYEYVNAMNAADATLVTAVVTQWGPLQSLANVLMYPDVLPELLRPATLARALGENEHHYLRLAAAVGSGRLDPTALDEVERTVLVDGLLDLIAGDNRTGAVRASVSVFRLFAPSDVGDVLPLLEHPDPAVRSNLQIGLMERFGTENLTAFLDDRTKISSGEAGMVRDRLVADGYDLDRPASQQQRRTALAYLPNLAEHAEQGAITH